MPVQHTSNVLLQTILSLNFIFTEREFVFLLLLLKTRLAGGGLRRTVFGKQYATETVRYSGNNSVFLLLLYGILSSSKNMAPTMCALSSSPYKNSDMITLSKLFRHDHSYNYA